MKNYLMTINFIIIASLAILSGRIKAEAATSTAALEHRAGKCLIYIEVFQTRPTQTA